MFSCDELTWDQFKGCSDGIQKPSSGFSLNSFNLYCPVQALYTLANWSSVQPPFTLPFPTRLNRGNCRDPSKSPTGNILWEQLSVYLRVLFVHLVAGDALSPYLPPETSAVILSWSWRSGFLVFSRKTVVQAMTTSQSSTHLRHGCQVDYNLLHYTNTFLSALRVLVASAITMISVTSPHKVIPSCVLLGSLSR